MFSSNDLVHLVFADEADTYYCDNLLKLNLCQYLWFELHEKYSSVYFLSLSENTFSVKTYGDLKCKAYEPTRKFLKWMGIESEIGEFGKWIHKQLTSKWSESAAFVCSLEDFCKAARYPDWASALDGIAREKNRTGILVLTVSVSVERSKRLFLEDPVFRYLHENAVLDVRTGALREMYGSIKRNKGESCVFLNTFSRDRVYAILLHISLEQKGRSLSREEMEAAAGYLVRYLASLELQRDRPLFNSRIPGLYMQFRDLYDQLKDENVWKRLMDRCLKEKDPAADPAEDTEVEFHVIWDKSGYAGKCLTLQIPNEIRQLDTEAERAVDILFSIQQKLLRPKNREENDKLTGKAASFLGKLDTVSHDDLGTYKRILEATLFCVTWMYIQEQSEEEKQVLKIVESLEGYIEISSQCCQLRKDVERSRQKSASGTLTDISIQQARNRMVMLEKTLRRYQDFVSASIMNLSMASFSDNIVEQMEELKQEVEEYRSARDVVSRDMFTGDGDLSNPFPDGGRPEDDAEPYALDAVDYIVTPPS